MVCWNRGDKTKGEYRSCLTSAQGDRRAAVEWAVMATVPWIAKIGPIKKIVDIGVTYTALREGLDTFSEEGSVTFFPDKFQGPLLQKMIKFIINPFCIFMNKDIEDAAEQNHKNGQNKYKLCWPFNKFVRFLIGAEHDIGGKGNSGFRNYCLKPLFKFFGCNPPLYYLDKNNNIIVEFENENKLLEPHEKEPTFKPIKEEKKAPLVTASV